MRPLAVLCIACHSFTRCCLLLPMIHSLMIPPVKFNPHVHCLLILSTAFPTTVVVHISDKMPSISPSSRSVQIIIVNIASTHCYHFPHQYSRAIESLLSILSGHSNVPYTLVLRLEWRFFPVIDSQLAEIPLFHFLHLS